MRRLLPVTLIAFAVCSCGPTEPTTSSTKSQTTPTTTKDDHEKYPPCHPGCFPAGTLVATPTGPKEIQTIAKGEIVTLVTTDGAATTGSVEDVFKTPNRLLEVRTDAGTVTTTETQPLCLQAGGFRLAGELKAGDTIWRWENGGRTAATVKEVTAPVREADVFNLVVGKDKVFIAGGFLARGKPPTDR